MSIDKNIVDNIIEGIHNPVGLRAPRRPPSQKKTSRDLTEN